ncbi:MAG: hypothetical protein BWK80_61760 [Desulfobacteraceae bacterium IS3]|nr:MAG: hypothetical protein BWK80_61760 [Desulfobacteraceae bacterium IS3]
MDKIEAFRKAGEYVGLIRNVLFFDKAVLFGSYAHGIPESSSDIDVGIFVNALHDGDDYLHLLSELYRMADKVDVRIEPHLFIRTEDRSGFAKESEKSGIIVG